MNLRLALASLGVAALSLTTGCQGCVQNGLNEDDAGGGSTSSSGSTRRDASIPAGDGGSIPDASMPDAAPITEVRTLTFLGTTPQTVFFSVQAPLRFKLVGPNGPVQSGTITFTQTGTSGSLNVAQAFTDNMGEGSVTFTAGTTAGQVTITAASQAAMPVNVVINVAQDPASRIEFTLTSATRIPVVRSEALFFVGANPPACGTLNAANVLPTASFNAAFTMLPGTRTFPNQVIGQKVTALAFGYNSYDQKFARNCVENITLVSGANAIMLALNQDATKYAGEYDVLLAMDLGTALPEPYQSNVGVVLDILADPAGYVTYQALAQSDSGGTTSFLRVPGSNPPRTATFHEILANSSPYNIYRNVRNLTDSLLSSQLGTTYTTVTTIGSDISGAITSFEIGARYTITDINMAPGNHVTENWKDVVFTWRYGCAVGDTGCARRPVRAVQSDLAPVATAYNAAVTREAAMGTGGETERFRVDPELHSISLRYGAIIRLMLENLVYPAILRAVNPTMYATTQSASLVQTLGVLVNCANVGAFLHTNVGAIDALTWQNLCQTGVNFAAGAVDQQLINLQVGEGLDVSPKGVNGVAAAGVYYLVDADHDLQTELVRDVNQYIQWVDQSNPTFSADVTAPITGEGRTKASNCLTDTSCTAPRVCWAIPDYLKVRNLEKDCRRPLGTSPGLAACTMNNTCQSGVCLGAVMGMTGLCYEPCNDVGTCAVGMCDLDAGAVDLTGVLAGLGTATTPACVQ